MNFKEFLRLDELDKQGLVTFVQQAATVPQLIRAAVKAPKLVNTLAQVPDIKKVSDLLTTVAKNPANDAVFAKANDPATLIANLVKSGQQRAGDYKSFIASLDQNQLGLLNQGVATKNFETFLTALKDPQKQTQFASLRAIFEKNPKAATDVKQAFEKLMTGGGAKPAAQPAAGAKPAAKPAAQPAAGAKPAAPAAVAPKAAR